MYSEARHERGTNHPHLFIFYIFLIVCNLYNPQHLSPLNLSSPFTDNKTHEIISLSVHSIVIFYHPCVPCAIRAVSYTHLLIKYKDKYLLFYIKGKKKLNEKLLHKALGITSIDELPQKPQGCIDNRRWFYLKNKKTNDSVFVQTDRSFY